MAIGKGNTSPEQPIRSGLCCRDSTRVPNGQNQYPAGDVPGWLANRFMVDAPVVTLGMLRAFAERQT